MPPRYLREAPVRPLSRPHRPPPSREVERLPAHLLLFNDPRYQRCNLQDGEALFLYDHHDRERLVGTLSGVVADGVLDCGHSAPFGGIDWVRRREPIGIIADLVDAAVRRARAAGIRELRLRGRPGYFGANENAVEFVLLNRGAAIERCEVSLAIDLCRYRSPDDYSAALSSFARNRLRHGLAAGLAFRQAESETEWEAAYRLLAETKRRRGTMMKVSLRYLMNLRQLFGSRIAMHRLLRGGDLAAAALVYRVAPVWDCMVAWGDDLRLRGGNVMNVMAYYLVGEAIRDGVAILDLGISSVDGIADDGLIQFKRSIGGMTGLRLDFRLPLAA